MHDRPTRGPRPVAALTLPLVLLSLLTVASVHAHEGHDHAAPPAASPADPNFVVRSVFNPRQEVVLKYRSLASDGHVLVRIYLSDFATNAPLRGAKLGFATTEPAAMSATVQALEPGVYEADLAVAQPGRYTAILTIEGVGAKSEFAFSELPLDEAVAAPASASAALPERGRAWLPWALGVLAALAILAILALRRRRMRRAAGPLDAAGLVLLAGALIVAARVGAHEGEDHGNPAPASAAAGGAGPRYVAKESQFLLGVRTVVARRERLYSQMTAVGRVTPESGALASVSAPQTGRIERTGRPLLVGDRVRRGQLLGYLLTIDRLPIRAPISGLVADVDFVPGQWVQAGQELMRVLDERQVRVEVPLFGENLTRALRSRSAVVRTTALPNRLFPARLRGLAPLASGGDGALGEESPREGGGAPIPPVLLSVVNEGSLLRPGMIVEASLELADSREVITVPEGAIVHQESGPAVFVHTAAELFELRPVALAGRYLDRVGIEGAVRDGERIVSEGAYSLVAAPAALAPAAATAPQAKTGATAQ